jgi:23S rRNA (cytidine1920-2'-O)/16S rRNA (cytidine1409-2'-O)-methyltransferase
MLASKPNRAGGVLRNHPRVINLERTDVSQLSRRLVPEPVEVVTMDLSDLPIADALPQIDHELLAPAARLVALVKPTYELHAGTLAARPDDVADAVAEFKHALVETGWQFIGQAPSPIRGTNGAIETFVLARRQTRSSTTPSIRSEPDDGY